VNDHLVLNTQFQGATIDAHRRPSEQMMRERRSQARIAATSLSKQGLARRNMASMRLR
jgi:hypothetical protein